MSESTGNDIGWAVAAMKAGKKVRRKGSEIYVSIGHRLGEMPEFIGVCGRDGGTHRLSTLDVLANDWELVPAA